MRTMRNVMTLAVALFAVVVMLSPPVVRAHEQETFVSWDVAYQYIDFTTVPVFIENGNRHVGQVDAAGNYATIQLDTGDRLVVEYSFKYIGEKERRGDLFWVTRLGLDFGTIGRYIEFVDPVVRPREWIGGSSFAFLPGQTYNATLVLRSLQPTLRHLHVGVAVQDVGNIGAAPTESPIPVGGPILYGIWTDAKGSVVEPLEGFNVDVGSFGTLKLLEPWPWAVTGLVAQIVIGLGFIIIMYGYGRWEKKRGAAT